MYLKLGMALDACHIEGTECKEAYFDVTRGIMAPVVRVSTRRMKGIIDNTL